MEKLDNRLILQAINEIAEHIGFSIYNPISLGLVCLNYEIDKIYGKIFQTLNSIYTKQIDKHKKFLQKQENIDFLY